MNKKINCVLIISSILEITVLLGLIINIHSYGKDKYISGYEQGAWDCALYARAKGQLTFPSHGFRYFLIRKNAAPQTVEDIEKLELDWMKMENIK